MGNFKSKTKFILLPGAIVVAITTQIPFIITIIYSLLESNLVRPDLGTTFVAFKNYISVLSNIEFYTVIFQTLVYTIGAIVLCSLIGVSFALLLNKKIIGINVARTIMIMPFFVMTTISGVLWKTMMLNGSFGWWGYLSNMFGINVPDLFDTYPLLMITLLVSWQWAPFFVLIILSGLQNISEEILENAKVEGANSFQIFIHIKLPMLIYYIQVAVMLGLIFITKEFGLIYTSTAGGPGIKSNTLTYYIFREINYNASVGTSATIAVITVVLILIILNILYKATQKKAGDTQ